MVDLDTLWSDDLACQVVCAMHPDGMGLDSIATVMGTSRSTIQAIEHSAMAKLRRMLPLNPAVGELFRAMAERSARKRSTWETMSDV